MDKQETVQIFNARTGQVEQKEKIVRSQQEWKRILTREQYYVTRQKRTERPFSGQCDILPAEGIYQCVGCGTDLFRAGYKFDSGTGWPGFVKPVSDLNVRIYEDTSYGMKRSEVRCALCDAHLGHVFSDGPPPEGTRYCINAAALTAASHVSTELAKATFAAGCFWSVEEAFRKLPGVVSTKAGYTGGHTKDPTYKDVCADSTGHAEAVEVIYDSKEVSYKTLLDVFWDIHDPTTLNRQGPDTGSQYRSVIFFHNESQEKEARASLKEREKSGKYFRNIVTEVVPAYVFYPAEEYHQKYLYKRNTGQKQP